MFVEKHSCRLKVFVRPHRVILGCNIFRPFVAKVGLGIDFIYDRNLRIATLGASGTIYVFGC